MKKKFLSLLLSVCMILSFVPIIDVSAATHSGTCGNGVTWMLEEGTLTITSTGEGTGRMSGYYNSSYAPWQPYGNIISVVINDGVTNIGSGAFKSCTELTSVEIPNSVTSIDRSAFSACVNLTSIEIPNSVTTIDDSAFQGCDSLTSIIIPDSVTNIGSSAFYNCSSLNSITIPDSVKWIGESAFSKTQFYEDDNNWENDVLYIGNHLIKAKNTIKGDYTIKPGTKTMTNRAFYGCGDLTSVAIPNSITNIGDSMFRECSSLINVEMPDSVTSIGNYAFSNCSVLTSVEMPDSVTNIGSSAFSNCYSLESIEISNRATHIGSEAFGWCSSLASVTISNSINTIESGAFRECNSLKSVYITDIESYLNIKFSDSKSNPLYYAGELYLNNELLTSLTIPDSITSIGDYVFCGCRSLKDITIHNNVTNIGSGAFYWCSGLTSVEIPDSVTNIGDSAFQLCSGLTNVTIPNSITTIKNNTFDFCRNLMSITIPNSVTAIGSNAFDYCDSLTSVNITDIESYLNIKFSDSKSNPLYYSGKLYLNNELLTSLTIPDSIISIGDYTFIGCSSLESITIPNNITSIGISAFSCCSGLTSVEIPDSVTYIGDSAFYGCSGLTSVTIPNSITTIGRSVFASCNGLTNITIPNSVTAIDYGAFQECSSLTSVTIPDSVTNIGSYAFYLCSNLGEVYFKGNAPTYESSSFSSISSSAIMYYYEGKTGFSTSLCGRPTFEIAKLRIEPSISSKSVAKDTEIKLSINKEAPIYYTIDGTEPTIESSVYSTPIIIDKPTTIKAMSVKYPHFDSDILTLEYRINDCELLDILSLSGETITGTNVSYYTLDENIYILAQVSDFATYKLYSDKNCTKEINNNLSLNHGNNTFYIKVTAEDGVTSKIYTVNACKQSDECDIMAIISPENAVLENTSISYSTIASSITIEAKVIEYASYEIYSNADCTNQITKNDISLNYGSNTFYIKVTAEDGVASKVYIMSVYRISTLCDITAVKQPQNAVIANNVISCSVTSEHVTPEFEVSENATYELYSDETCTTKIDSIALNYSDNIFYIKVTAEDGITSKVYTMNIRRKLSSCDITAVKQPQNAVIANNVISCSVTSEHVTPEFEVSENATYELYSDETCTTKIDSIALNYSDNIFYIKVTAEDGITSKVYTMNIRRKLSSCDITAVKQPQNAVIANNVISCSVTSEHVTPEFEVSENATYELYSDKLCTAKVNSFTLNHGNNTFYVKVTAEDGVTSKVYTMNIKKINSSCDIISVIQPQNAVINDNIISCRVTTEVITPEFEVSENAAYELYSDETCKNAVTKIKLDYGNNIFYVKVTAEDDVTSKVYTMNIYRISTLCDIISVIQPQDTSITNNVISCNLTEESITPKFEVSENATYELYSDETCTVKVNNFTLTYGNNTFYIKVTAEDGVTSKVYTMNIYRPSDECNINDITSFDNDIIEGNHISCQTEESSAGIEAEVSKNATYSVYADANCTNEISNRVNLNYGDNTFYIKVIAEDKNTSKVYTLNITRLYTDCQVIDITTSDNEVISGSNIYCRTNLLYFTIKATVSENATYNIYSDKDCSQTRSATVSLGNGDNIVYIKVTAENGNSNIYTMNIHKPYDTTRLSSVTFITKNGTSVINVDDTTSNINYQLENDIDEVEIIPHTEDNATYEILEGDKEITLPYVLKVGINTLCIKVTSEDGLNDNKYTLNIERKEKADIPQLQTFYNNELNPEKYVKENSVMTLSNSTYDSEQKNYKIYYTLDGTTPNKSSSVYDGTPIPIAQDVTVKAFLSMEGMTDSDICTFKIYVIKDVMLSTVKTSSDTITFDLIDAKTNEKTSIQNMESVFVQYALPVSDNEIIQWNTATLTESITDTTTQVTVINLQEDTTYLFRLYYQSEGYRGNSSIVEEKTTISSQAEIITVISPENSVWSDDKTTINADVMNSVESVVVNLIVSKGATYQLYKDTLCKIPYQDNIMPLEIGENTAYIKVTAKDGWTTQRYIIKVTRHDKVKTPTMNSIDGYIEPNTNIELTTKTPGASIRYTTDGTKPSQTNGILYEKPIVMVGDYMRINAIAYKTGMEDSEIAVFDVANSIPINDLKCMSTTETTAELTFTYPEGAEEIKVLYSTDNNTWNVASAELTAQGATVKELTPDMLYYFKIYIIGGMNSGNSNVVTGTTTKIIYTPDLKINSVVKQNHLISDIVVTGNAYTQNGIGIVAVYNSEGILKCLETTVSKTVTEEGTYRLNNSVAYENTDTYKVFVWDGLDTMKPLTEVFERIGYDYSIDTICQVDNLENMTVANTGHIYYEANNIVYQCDIETGEVQEFFNPEGMEYQDGNAWRRGFNIDLIFFNNYSDKLYMCGHYTTKDYEEELTNCAIYEITDQTGKNIYFSETYGYVGSYFYSVLPVSESMVYIYSVNGISTRNDHSVWFDLNSGTYLKAGSAFYADEYIFKGDDEYYTYAYNSLMHVGGKSATGTPEKIKELTDNAIIGYGNMNNTQGFTGYNEKLYYAGETSGDIYCIDLVGNTSKYIYAKDVYQHGDNFVDTSFYARLEYFSMEYNGLPIWYDDSLKTIKRYVKN